MQPKMRQTCCKDDVQFQTASGNVAKWVTILIASMWRRTCSPGDPTPEWLCAWLLSTYLKEGKEQKGVLEAKDDEEKESELDGEVEERVTQHAHETWR